jgi:DNA modification methylase
VLNEIINADCLSVLPKIKSKSIDLVLTDIPYNEVDRPSNGLRKLNKGHSDILTFDLQKFLIEINRVCHGSHYIFCGTLQISTILKYFKEEKLTTRICIWQKSNPSPMNGQHMWLSGIECCAFAKNKNATFNEHCKAGIWKYPCGRNKYHPTQKPLNLFKYLIETSTQPGDLVLDPCLGSGTTAIAAIQTKRNYIGIELFKDYYDVAINNILKST